MLCLRNAAIVVLVVVNIIPMPACTDPGFPGTQPDRPAEDFQIDGTVTASDTGDPIAAALVRLYRTECGIFLTCFENEYDRAPSNHTGQYAVQGTSEWFHLTVEVKHPDYVSQSQDVGGGHHVVDFVLDPVAP